MPRPKQISDEELLKIALECFLEHGPTVSTQLIADRVGLSQPALFKRFGTKEELFLRALTPPARLPILDWLDASPSPGPFRPQLVEMLEKVWETLSWVLPQVRLIREARIPRGTVMSRYKIQPPVQLIMSIEGYFERARQQGQVRGDLDPRPAAQWVFGVMLGRSYLSATLHLKTDSKDVAAFVESTTDLLCRGIMKDKKGE